MSPMQAHDGFIPSGILLRIARNHPELPWAPKSIARTLSLFNSTHKSRRALLKRFANNGTGKREVYDAQNKTKLPGVRARFENDPEHKDPLFNLLYDLAGKLRQYLMEVYGINSIDAHGMVMMLIGHFDKDYANAFWDGLRMVFGDGDGQYFLSFVKPDVLAHEIRHGVTEFSAGTVYQDQPGALNEHYSDCDGEMFEQWLSKQTADQANWLLGEGIFGPKVKGARSLRDMLNPGTAYDDPELGKDPQPGHMKDFVDTPWDNGGVHINSGIPNRAFANFARMLGGFSWEVAGKIWYPASVVAGANPSFAQFAQCTLDACEVVKGSERVRDAADVAKVRKHLQAAWDLVGVVPSANAA